VSAREDGGAFTSIWDFTDRVDPQVVNKRALESLVKCGALDSSGSPRMGMLDVLEHALSWGGRQQADRLAGQASIFDSPDEPDAPRERHHPAIPSEEYDNGELLRLEKETLGLYVSEHPLDRVRDQLRRRVDIPLGELERRRDGEVVTIGGIVSALKQLTTKKGDPMVFLRLDDVTGGAEVVVFASVYAQTRPLLELDRIVVVKGRTDHKEGEVKLLAQEVAAFEAVAERREVRLKVDARRVKAGVVRDLAVLVRDFPGESPVIVSVETSLGPKVLQLGPGFRVAPDADFFAEVKALLGEAAVA
jgi:DNA polymerase-3 subunit alpha